MYRMHHWRGIMDYVTLVLSKVLRTALYQIYFEYLEFIKTTIKQNKLIKYSLLQDVFLVDTLLILINKVSKLRTLQVSCLQFYNYNFIQ